MWSYRSSRYPGAAAAVVTLGLATGVQARELILIDQTRTVSAQAMAGNAEQTDDDADFDQAMDFGPFESTVYADARVTHCESQCHAAQTSEWVGNELLANGDVGAHSWSAPLGEPIAGSAESESLVRFVFELTTPAEFSITGDLEVLALLGTSSPSAGLTLVGPSGTIIDLRADPVYAPHVVIDEAGSLDAGVYTLTVSSSIDVASNIIAPDNMGFSSYELAAVVRAPCAADVDGSGAADFADILAILAAWGNAGGPEDVNGNGTVEFGDVLAVLAAWGPCD